MVETEHLQPEIVFVVEKFGGLLQGKESLPLSQSAQLFKKPDELLVAMNKQEFTKLPLQFIKDLQAELLGKVALSLGIVKKGAAQEGAAAEFPPKLKDFLVFYKLLVNFSKTCVIKHDEHKLFVAVEKCRQELSKVQGEIDALEFRMMTVADLAESLDADFES
mmetsp:Transcript_9705/g.16338  ORF Transcript_9705/g.16338 Transcript_9705/m.16338 type:complete len:163 (-) Transcript_9705:797-1285(-)